VFGALAGCMHPADRFHFWLAERYEPLIAASALAGCFLLLTIVALFCSLRWRRSTIERAELGAGGAQAGGLVRAA
jgi:hypothetical protein